MSDGIFRIPVITSDAIVTMKSRDSGEGTASSSSDDDSETGKRRVRHDCDEDDATQEMSFRSNGSSSDCNTDGMTDGNCLPSVQEIKDSNNHHPKKKLCDFRMIVIIFSATTMIVSIIAMTAIWIEFTRQRSHKNGQPRNFDIQELVSYVTAKYDVEFYPSIDAPNSPQYMAAKWMSQEDGLNLKLPSATNGESNMYEYHFMARFVMAINYFSLGGPSWLNQLNFLSDSDICSWVGYVSTGSLVSDVDLAGVFCDADTGIPNELSLYYNGMTGSIPTENGLLTSLNVFDVKYNDIEGTIPTELCKLTGLTSLFFGENNIRGEIPDCLGNLQQMKRLFWSNNYLEGTLPQSMSQMTLLERLIVDDNTFTGNPIEILQSMSSLKLLMLSDNEFQGTIDDEFLSNHQNLTVIDLSKNNFTSEEIPKHLFAGSYLQILDLSINKLRGSIPSSLDASDTVQFISLYGNEIGGIVPSDIHLLKGLTHLDLSNNLLTGTLPSEMGNMQNLTYLFISNNPYLNEGGVPSWMTSLTQLQELSMRNTNRVGSLPTFAISVTGGDNGNATGNEPALVAMDRLVLLDLGSNNFTGSIPQTWGQLSSLEFLLLNNNAGINGSVPTSLGNATNLRAIFLDGTSIDGSLDDTLCKLPMFATDDSVSDSVMYASCSGESPMSGNSTSTSIVDCSCCICCDAQHTSGCSQPSLSNLDASWERNFKRLSYSFVNDTLYWDSDIFPNLA